MKNQKKLRKVMGGYLKMIAVELHQAAGFQDIIRTKVCFDIRIGSLYIG